jgi:hypothetical protein
VFWKEIMFDWVNKTLLIFTRFLWLCVSVCTCSHFNN